MAALPLPPITTLLSETPKFSYSKPFHKSSPKRPNLISNHNHFWIDSSILFNYSKPLISDHLMHGMVSLFAVCTTPLRVYKRGTTCVSNFIACNNTLQESWCPGPSLARDPCGWFLWKTTSSKWPLDLRILGGRLWEVWLYHIYLRPCCIWTL